MANTPYNPYTPRERDPTPKHNLSRRHLCTYRLLCALFTSCAFSLLFQQWEQARPLPKFRTTCITQVRALWSFVASASGVCWLSRVSRKHSESTSHVCINSGRRSPSATSAPQSLQSKSASATSAHLVQLFPHDFAVPVGGPSQQQGAPAPSAPPLFHDNGTASSASRVDFL